MRGIVTRLVNWLLRRSVEVASEIGYAQPAWDSPRYRAMDYALQAPDAQAMIKQAKIIEKYINEG